MMQSVAWDVEILACPSGEDALRLVEMIGRTAYRSEERITSSSAAPFVRMLIARGHESVIEHVGFTVRFRCDRAIATELRTHRLASFTQESTRYCNYASNGRGVSVVPPDGNSSYGEKIRTLWASSVRASADAYEGLVRGGVPPELARSVLPLCTATTIVVTANVREWRHIFRLRTAKAAHPQMREIMIPLLEEMRERLPVFFEDLEPYKPPRPEVVNETTEEVKENALARSGI